MQATDRVWYTYETTLKRIIAGVETSEVKHFAGICPNSVLKMVDWYYNDHLATEDESENSITVWVYKLVNLKDPQEKIVTDRPEDWPIKSSKSCLSI